MKRYIETVFRIKWLLAICALLVLGVASGALYLSKQGDYSSSATVWVDKPIYLPADPGSNPYISAAAAQADILKEFLLTRRFKLAIAQKAGIPTPNTRAEDQVISDIQHNLHVDASGTHLVTITCTGNKNSHCREIIQASIDEFIAELNSDRAHQATVAMQVYEQQRATYQQQMNQSKAALDKYLADNPDALRLATADPTLLDLQQQYQTDKARYDDVVTRIDQISADSQAGAEYNNSFFRVIDPPQDPTPYVFAMKDLLKNELLALGIALVSLLGLVLAAAWTDQAVYTLSDVAAVIGPGDESSPELIVAALPFNKALAEARRLAQKESESKGSGGRKAGARPNEGRRPARPGKQLRNELGDIKASVQVQE